MSAWIIYIAAVSFILGGTVGSVGMYLRIRADAFGLTDAALEIAELHDRMGMLELQNEVRTYNGKA